MPSFSQSLARRRHDLSQGLRRYDPGWLALRVSYGFNGVIIPGKDLPSLTDHLTAHFDRRPPDHLLFEWFSGERDDTRCATGIGFTLLRTR